MPHSFRLAKPSKTRSAIFMDVTFRGRRYRKPLNESTYVTDWNAKEQRCRVVKRNEFAEAINEKIDAWEAAVKETIKHFTPMADTPPQEVFWEQFDKELSGGEAPSSPSFPEYIDRYLATTAKGHSKSRRSTIKRTSDWVRRLEETVYRRTLRLDDIDIDFYGHLKHAMFAESYSANTFGSFIKVIKAVCRDARQRGIDPCIGIDHRGFVAPNETADTIYLTEEELLRIHALRFTPESVLEMHHMAAEANNEDPEPGLRKLRVDYTMKLKLESCETVRAKFLIGAFTALRVSDFNSLTPNNIRGDFMVVPIKKSGYTRKVTIPIHWVIREIIESGFDVATPIAEQNINDHIKEICLLAGITDEIEITRNVGGKRIREVKEKWQLVTNHTARRSAATNMYKSGIPSLAIMQITGHTTEKSFLKYIKISAEENAEILARHSFFAKR